MNELKIKYTEQGNILIASFTGSDRINAVLADSIKNSFLSRISTSKIKLIVDLKGINFIDSSGFSLLLAAMKTVNQNSGTFKICNISSKSMELFKILQLQNVFDLFTEMNDCIGSFS